MTNAELEAMTLADAVAEIGRMNHEVEYMNREIEERDATITELRATVESLRDQLVGQNSTRDTIREDTLFQCVRDYQEKIAQLTERRARPLNALFRKEVRL